MTDNGQAPERSTDEVLAGILEPVRERAGELRAQKQRLVDAIAEIDAELRKLGAVERAADRDWAKPGPSGQKAKAVRGSKADTVERVLAAIREHATDEPFAAKDVRDWARCDGSTARRALDVLRAQEIVRYVGKQPRAEGQFGQLPATYRLMADGTAD